MTYDVHLDNYKRVTAYICCAAFLSILFGLFLFFRVKRISYVVCVVRLRWRLRPPLSRRLPSPLTAFLRFSQIGLRCMGQCEA